MNDICIIAFPGETFSSTAIQLVARSGCKKIITVTEHDRTLMYLPPPKEFASGGYETTCCLTEPAAVQILEFELLSMIATL